MIGSKWGKVVGPLDMTGHHIILVAAPDAGFRHSIEFALASGRFEVDAHRYASDAFASARARQAACAVLDDEAVQDWKEAPQQFERFARPVILLVSLFRTAPSFPMLKPLAKPFLGEPLIEAVRNAIAGLL